MAIQKATVLIYENGIDTKELITRSIRITPNGTAGVSYLDKVFNLRPENIIDVASQYWEPAECKSFLQYGHDIPYYFGPASHINAPIIPYTGDWLIEEANNGYYLLFDGSEQEALNALLRIANSEIKVTRWDVSVRLSSTGKYFDWFARLAYSSTKSELENLLTEVFRVPENSATDFHEGITSGLEKPFTAQVEFFETSTLLQLQQQNEILANLNREHLSTIVEYQNAENRHAFALNESHLRELELSSTLIRAEKQIEILRIQLQNISGGDIETVPPNLLKIEELNQLLEELELENKRLIDERNILESNNFDFESQIIELGDVIEGLNQELVDKTEQLKDFYRAPNKSNIPKRGVEGFLDQSFRRIQFIDQSIETILDFEDSREVLSFLVDIERKTAIATGKTAIGNWWKGPHLFTGIKGRENMGRIYYIDIGERVLVSVYLKKDAREQDRHFRKLDEIAKQARNQI